jgi:hypothetical protein
MLDTMIAYLWPEAMTQYTVVGREATTADPTARPDLIFETADGYITVGTISDSEWQGFCAASGRSGLAEDSRFNTPGGRAANATERILLMAQIIKERPTAEWLELLDANDVPWRANSSLNWTIRTSGSSASPNPRRASIAPRPRSEALRRASASRVLPFWQSWGSGQRKSNGWRPKRSCVW